ncbi:MAG: IS200/IS605 family transposase [Treponema sp.]|jgi:REP element-mobilizing transposase RayT|nr:IS200/IS605 family transposase [Treponema sp.]
MSGRIRKPRDASVIMCHITCPAKYRRAATTRETDEKLRESREGMEARCEIKFLEAGTGKERAPFPARSVPTYSFARMTQIIKSVTARKIFEARPEVKKLLWGGEFRTKGCRAGTAGGHEDEKAIARYAKNQRRKPGEYE